MSVNMHTRSKAPDPDHYPFKRGQENGKISIGRPKKHKVSKSKPRTSTTASSKICQKYLQNLCPGGCGYQHRPVCRKFLEGRCKKGCKFAHPIDPAFFERELRLLEIEKEEALPTQSTSMELKKGNEEQEHLAAGQTAHMTQHDEERPARRYGMQCRRIRSSIRQGCTSRARDGGHG
ncbi:hypothetical protein P171DRAFT_497498 [Karstenula rhodostoma CBS 690.94]|uniref:C3H1-type domain-containing protein n=1 Tax=Karstenula rhodostoma CBS 690.94 TaxID=1392251 RepID=A0A9P4U8Q0_9PLEO|nr:hypothetical protein P171DRAFT_497498 [Karstenula rhodostoma CBS 690.94]